MAEWDLSLQYHSLRIYDGTTDLVPIDYRIGDKTIQIVDEVEQYYDTWDDFHLIPAERPTFSVPSPNTKLISIPGSVVPLDFSEWLTGHVTYGNRTGSWTFYTNVDYVDQHLGGWINFDRFLRAKLHSHFVKISLRDDPAYFYAGYLSLGEWKTGDSYSSITISYNVYPYKKDMCSSMEMWRWDDFDFKDGVIQYLKDMIVEAGTEENPTIREVIVYGSPERISPHITCTINPNNASHPERKMYIYKRENNEWKLYGHITNEGLATPKTVIPRLVIDDGVNRLQIRNKAHKAGSVTIDYRRGLL